MCQLRHNNRLTNTNALFHRVTGFGDAFLYDVIGQWDDIASPRALNAGTKGESRLTRPSSKPDKCYFRRSRMNLRP